MPGPSVSSPAARHSLIAPSLRRPQGRILRASHAELSLSPNGNGGVYLSLLESGMLDHLEAAGVTSVFQFGVDNVR
eukprot:scaffold244350_cov28-Tisochrysis_lutea.AAC.2